MRLVLLHPTVAARSCDDCRKYVYEDGPKGFGGRLLRRGLPVLRPRGTATPCVLCPKQPEAVAPHERTPDTAVELSPHNWRAFAHYRECKAVGHFPDDPIVRRNAALIADAERLADRLAQLQAAAVAGSFRGMT